MKLLQNVHTKPKPNLLIFCQGKDRSVWGPGWKASLKGMKYSLCKYMASSLPIVKQPS